MVTDTIYGIVGLALDKDVVERIYRVKKRNIKKPFIILISSKEDLEDIFKITLSEFQKKIIDEFWPGPASIILPCRKFPFLNRGLNEIAFRLPDDKRLRTLIKGTGPLIATSANPEGKNPARDIKEARKYFGADIDFYIDSGKSKDRASLLLRPKGNNLEVLRGKLCLKK